MLEKGCDGVLVVDDEPDIVEVMSLLLMGAGYQVLTAHNGREALDILKSKRPCVILLDLNMPVMDGWQFRSEQLKDPRIAELPVVVLTGAGVASAQRSGQFSLAGLLQKPISADRLLQVVAENCGAAQR